MQLTENEFLDLVEDNQGLLHKVCHTYSNGEEDYKDLFQEVMLQLWQSFTGFRGESKATTWMYRVALYTAISRLKKGKTEIKKKNEIAVVSSHNPLEDQYELDDLRFAIKGLSQIERALIALYLDEKSYQEISEILGISENNVGVRLNRIKKKLREKLIV